MSNESSIKANPINANDIVRNAGFVVMLTWHYLVLFTPLLSNGYFQLEGADISSRQLTLYLSLAVSFIAIAVLSPLLSKRIRGIEYNPFTIAISGLASTLISAFCIVSPADSLLVITVFTALLGACEAIMMWLWLSCMFNERTSHDTLHVFSVNMILAGLLSLLVSYLQIDVSKIVAILLPLATSFVLFREARLITARSSEKEAKGRDAKKNADADDEAPHELDWNKTFKASKEVDTATQDTAKRKFELHLTPAVISTLFTMSLLAVFGFVFGILQGFFVGDDIYLLMANRPLVLLGIILAGVIVFLAPKQHGVVFGANMVHHYALVLIVIGIAVLYQGTFNDFFLLVSEITILAGFNCFDSSAMMLGINSTYDDDDRIVHLASGGRPVVYSGLFLGLLLGRYLSMNTPPPGDDFQHRLRGFNRLACSNDAHSVLFVQCIKP